MALDYSDTGHFYALGQELCILEAAARRISRYSRLINGSWPGSGNPYFKSVLNTIYVNTAQASDEAETRSKENLKEVIEAGAQAMHAARLSWMEGDEGILRYIAKAMELDDIVIAEGPILYEYDEELLSETGEVAILHEGGILGALKRQMVADAESIRVSSVTLGAITARPGNTGNLTEITVGGGRSHALNGKLVLKCVDDTVGRTILAVGNVLTEQLVDGTTVVGADNNLTVDTDFTDGPTAVTLQVRYVDLVETGDDGDVLADPSWDIPNETNSDKGKLYLRLTRVGLADADFLWEWFNNANREPENLVGSRKVLGTAGDTPVMIPGSQSNLSFTFDRTAAAAHLPNVDDTDENIVLDLQVPRVNDEWTKTVTNDDAGVFSKKLAQTWRASLTVATNPAQTIPDTLATDFAIAN